MARHAAASLPIQLDPRGHGDLHEQIYRELRRAIVARTLRPHTRIASSRALAADLGVSRTTTQLALDQLQAEGYLVTRRGSGTFVAEELPDEVPPPVAPVRPSRGEPVTLSRRGAALAGGRPVASRLAGPARAFRLGTPALELFPVALWSRLAGRRVAAMTMRDLDYGGAAGLPALRAAIAEHTRIARGARCEADQIYIVGGAQRGLDFISRLLLDAGASAAVEDPGYPGAWTALAAAAAQIVPVPVDDEGASVAALAGEPDVRMVYVTPSHQFPSGVPMSLARRRALLAWAATSGAWVVEDDYDCEFRFGAQPVPCLQGLDPAGRVIYVGTFSKSLYPALRLGFVIAPPALHERLVAARRALADPQPPVLDQAILAEFIAQGHFARHLRRMRAVYAERLEALVESAARYGGGALALRPTRTGLHAVADVIGADATRVAAEALRRGVEVMPLSAYALEPSRGGNALALGFSAVTPERIQAGMRDLVAAIEVAMSARPEVAIAGHPINRDGASTDRAYSRSDDSSRKGTLMRRWSILGIAAFCTLLGHASLAEAGECKKINAEIDLVTGTIEGNFGLDGTVVFAADSSGSAPSTGPAGTGVFSGPLTITTDRGVLIIRETGMFSSRPGNPLGGVLYSLGEAVSGTGRFAGVTGDVFFTGHRINGTFLVDVRGVLCRP